MDAVLIETIGRKRRLYMLPVQMTVGFHRSVFHLARVGFLCVLMVMLLPALGGCGHRTLRIDWVPVEDRLKPETIESAEAGLTSNKIAMINVSGLIANTKPKSLLSSGTNPVSDMR